MSEKVDLVETIKANPGCVIRVAEDEWWLTRTAASTEILVDDSNVDREKLGPVTELYGCARGPAYGGDVLQALARIVGVRVESV